MRMSRGTKRIVIALVAVGLFGLLSAIGIIRPNELRQRARSEASQLKTKAGGALAVPSEVTPQAIRNAEICRDNLRRIENAKTVVRTRSASATGTPTLDQVLPQLGGQMPVCPEGGTYSLRSFEQLPTCSVGARGNSDDRDNHLLRSF